MNVDATGLDFGQVAIELDFCAGSANANGIQGAFHAMVWFKPSDGNTVEGGPADVLLSGNGAVGVGEQDTGWSTTGWADVPSDFVGTIGVNHVEVSVEGIAQRKGILYFDNMHFD